MTREEKHLWYDFLKKLPKTFNRQKVIGDYVVDFCCASEKIIIEIDGMHHYKGENPLNDLERNSYLENQGFRILRYTNCDIHEKFDDVCREILMNIGLIWYNKISIGDHSWF